MHHLSSWCLEHTLLPSRVELSDMICSGLGPAGITRECRRLRGGRESRGEWRAWSPHRHHHHPPTHRRKQGCYNLFSWLSIKERGRATRALLRLDLLPLTPTVYLLSAISSFPSFSLPICPSLVPALYPLPYLLIQDLTVATFQHS